MRAFLDGQLRLRAAAVAVPLLAVPNSDLHRKQAHIPVGGQPAPLAAQKVEPELERGLPYPVASGELRVGLAGCCLVLVNDLRPELPSLPLHGCTLRGWPCPGQDVSDRTVTNEGGISAWKNLPSTMLAPGWRALRGPRAGSGFGHRSSEPGA
jgi:hypothetical protein